MTPQKNGVVLVYPSCEKDNPGMDTDFADGWRNIPIGILSIATYIKTKGYDPKVIDCRSMNKAIIKEKLDSSINSDTLCVGFSLMTMQIAHGMELIDYVKEKYNLPVIVGGIHGTLFPKETVADKSVDYVIVGEGEKSFHSLLQHLQNGSVELKDIRGLCYKNSSGIFMNDIDEPLDVQNLPFPDYDLIENIELYINRKFYKADGTFFETRSLDFHTSRGCPYRCAYCINTLPFFKKWRSKRLEDVLDHLDKMISKYNLNYIWFMDDFFFGDPTRVRTIAEHIISKNYNIRWEATARANLFEGGVIDDDFLALLKKAGCYSLGFGFESGSERILKKIRKGITVEQMINVVRQCKKHDIIPRVSFMCGVPTEEKEDIKKTGKLIIDLKKIYPEGVYYSPGLFRPYPGSELYQECIEYGFKEPKSLREWGQRKFDFGLYMSAKELPWISYPNWLRNYQIYLHLASLRLTSKSLRTPQSLPYRLFGELALFRIEHNFFAFAIEPFILIKARKYFSWLERKRYGKKQ